MKIILFALAVVLLTQGTYSYKQASHQANTPQATQAASAAPLSKEVPKPKPAPKRAVAAPQGVLANPNKCDLESQWVWEDGSCHDKAIRQVARAAGGCEQYRPLVARYGWDVRTAMAIMEAESTNPLTGVPCDANAANWNDNHGVCMGSFGLFQISCHSGQVYDPARNVAIAWQKYQASGWQPWGAYTSGAYVKYLQ